MLHGVFLMPRLRFQGFGSLGGSLLTARQASRDESLMARCRALVAKKSSLVAFELARMHRCLATEYLVSIRFVFALAVKHAATGTIDKSRVMRGHVIPPPHFPQSSHKRLHGSLFITQGIQIGSVGITSSLPCFHTVLSNLRPAPPPGMPTSQAKKIVIVGQCLSNFVRIWT